MNFIKKIYFVLEKNLFLFFIFLNFLMIIGAILEMVGISLVVPIILTLLKPETQQTNIFFENLNYFLFFDNNIISLISIVLIFYIIKNFFIFFLSILSSFFTYLVHTSTAKEIFKNYINQDYKFHVKKNLADLIRNVNEEVYIFQNAINQLILLLTEIFVVFGIICLIFYFEPRATLLLLFTTLILAFLFIFLSKKYYVRWGENRIVNSGLANKLVLETLNALKELKIYQRTNLFFINFNKAHSAQARMSMRINIFASVPKSWLETIGVIILFSIVFFYLSLNKSANEISEVLVLFSFCAIRLLPSISRIINHFSYIRYFSSTLDLMYNEVYLLKKNKEYSKNKYKIEIPNFKNSISLKNIDFEYSSKDEFKLKDINLIFKKNSFVGLQGKSGSGKSTIIDLILGIISPNNGHVYIDEKKISDGYTITNNWVSYVPQSVYLTDDTITNNIALGVKETDIDREKIDKSLKMAGLFNFINSLHLGAETKVGENGIRLSGGQKQRIGIARALYNEPSLLILDESTSALDINTENDILESISNLKGKITILIISHRENTLKICDKIFKIQNGKII